jgi:hypothetical protein
MSDLTSAAPLRVLGEAYTNKFVMDTSSGQTIYQGGPAIIDQSVDTLNVRTAAGVTCLDGDVFAGIAAETKTVATSDPEKTQIEVYTYPTILGFKSSVFTNADMGKTVYMSDTATLTSSNGAYPEIGKLHIVEAGWAFVELKSPIVLNVP